MKSKTVDALLWPFENSVISLPAMAQGIFLNAVFDSALKRFEGPLTCVQGRRPEYLALEAAGLSVAKDCDSLEPADFVLCALSKHKAQAQAEMARGLSLLKPGGYLICAGRNDSGAASLAKTAQKLGNVLVQSKYHHRIFWIQKGAGDLPSVCSDWIGGGNLQHVKTIDAVSSPAVFGWNKIDKGSQLLVEQFDDHIRGHVVDLGGGWGYLSCELLARCAGVSELTLIEAEAVAVEAATQNLAPFAAEKTIRCLWQDVTTEVSVRLADYVVMNPPFHSGKDADMDLGLSFIRTARKTLRPGGCLFMVANRHLPYEAELSKVFKKTQQIAETPAFKVIKAIA